MSKDFNLTENDARNRSSVVSTGMKYRVFLDLHKGKVFNGLVHLTFEAKKQEDTFLEFAGKEVVSFEVNGDKVEEFKWEAGCLLVSKDRLKEGQNEIRIHFNSEYFNDGNGIHSFIDENGLQYIHSQCEPHAANRIFPVFDQPDLKGTYELVVRAPASWAVITNESAVQQSTWQEFAALQSEDALLAEVRQKFALDDAQNEFKFLHFGVTPQLSTYLYTIVCGDFVSVECPVELLHRGIPQTIYCKRNLLEFAQQQAKNIFETNSKGVEKYEQIFGYPYPFRKCDTIFCPEYTMGAMENPGAITYNEGYLYPNVPSRSDETERVSTILHELAHMWFGDLVTMVWWDDLWLNESFADFVCYLNMYLIKDSLSFEIDDSWLTMHLRKSFGYNADESASTTHPIYAEVPDIHTTQSIFDGITYSKGASVLKQLYCLIGLDNFCKGMSHYFNKHQWSNTRLKDLLESLETCLPAAAENPAYNLKKFRQDWIEEAGHDVLSCVWSPTNDSKHAPLTIIQEALLEEYPLLRYHKIQVGFYGSDGKLLYAKDVIVENQRETHLTYDGSVGVAGVVLNYDDMDFVKIRIDDSTFKWVEENFVKIDSPLTKALICRSLFDMVKEATSITNFQFLYFFIKVVAEERDTVIIELLNSFASTVLLSFCDPALHDSILPKLFPAVHASLLASTDAQLLNQLLEMLVAYAHTAEHLDVLKSLVEGQVAHVKPTLRQKYKIVFVLHSAQSHLDAGKELYAKLSDSDETDLKNEYKLMIRGLTMTAEDREKLFCSIEDDSHALSFEQLSNLLFGFNHRRVPYAVRDLHHERIFEKLPAWINGKTHEMSKTICQDLMPGLADKPLLNQKLEQVIDKIENNYFIRHLKKRIDQNNIAIKIINFGQSALKQ